MNQAFEVLNAKLRGHLFYARLLISKHTCSVIRRLLAQTAAVGEWAGRPVTGNDLLFRVRTAAFKKDHLEVVLYVEIHNHMNGPRLQFSLRRSGNRGGIYSGAWIRDPSVLLLGYKHIYRIGSIRKQAVWVDFVE